MLNLSFLCERFNCLPEPGSLLDQDAPTLLHMVHLRDAYEAFELVAKGKANLLGAGMARVVGQVLGWLQEEEEANGGS